MQAHRAINLMSHTFKLIIKILANSVLYRIRQAKEERCVFVKDSGTRNAKVAKEKFICTARKTDYLRKNNSECSILEQNVASEQKMNLLSTQK